MNRTKDFLALLSKEVVIAFYYLLLMNGPVGHPIFAVQKQTRMNYLLQLEELAQFALAIGGLYYQPIHLSWWVWPVVFFAPDLGMLGYLINTTVGAFTYNLVHHKLTAVAVLAIGYFTQQPALVLAGLILYGHASFDRMFGYGLKYNDAFKHTHLGWM